MKGGAGNDDIDGGQGFDTAVYSGSFFEYDIAAKGTGNDKVTVTDLVANRDGIDNLKQVEALEFAGGVTIRLDQNNAAVTRADTATTTEDSSVVIDVLANDKDFEGDALHISAINGQAIAVGGTVVLGDGSSVTLNANQTLTFNPDSAFQSLNGGEQAHEIFTYTVTDSQGASSAPTSVDVTVNGAWEAPTFFVNGEVDEKGQKPATEDVINGTGIPATGYQLVRADDAGIELGLQVHYRNGPVVLPTDGNGYADGVIEFQVADGPQTPATSPGFPAAPNRAAWSFDYSVITGLNGESTDLADFTFVFKVDIDPTAATNFQAFTMSPVGTGSAGVHWTNQFGDAVVDDNGILGEVAQNSRNLAFYDVDHVTPGTQPYDPAFGPGQFDIVLQAFDGSNTLIAQNHIHVDVI
ncbi:MAG TPA: Ig-like domain-containing protein [Beijerinckiaceae bacterium]|nr:Ig-like domain-containing protein [Beijerinckiaceae bacterium]